MFHHPWFKKRINTAKISEDSTLTSDLNKSF